MIPHLITCVLPSVGTSSVTKLAFFECPLVYHFDSRFRKARSCWCGPASHFPGISSATCRLWVGNAPLAILLTGFWSSLLLGLFLVFVFIFYFCWRKRSLIVQALFFALFHGEELARYNFETISVTPTFFRHNCFFLTTLQWKKLRHFRQKLTKTDISFQILPFPIDSHAYLLNSAHFDQFAKKTNTVPLFYSWFGKTNSKLYPQRKKTAKSVGNFDPFFSEPP